MNTLIRGIILTILVFFGGSAAMWCAEGHTDMFKGFGDCLWYSMVTMTTVGYGDKYPVTAAGRLIGACLMMMGIALLGTVLGMLASYLIERKRKEEMGLKSFEDKKGHLLICNYDDTDREILIELRNDKPSEEIVILSSTLKERPEYFDDRIFYVNGQSTSDDDLKRAGAQGASNVIVLSCKNCTSNKDAETILSVLSISKLNSSCYICAEMQEQENHQHLKNAGASTIITWSGMRNKLFAQEVVDRGVTAVITDLISTVVGEQQIRKIVIDGARADACKDFGTLLAGLKSGENMIAIAVEREEKITVNPDSSFAIKAGDAVFCIAR